VSQSTVGDRARKVLKDFLRQIDKDGRVNLVHDMLLKSHVPEGADIGRRPEEYVEDKLIWPLLDAFELDYEERPYKEGGLHPDWPDFEIKNIRERSPVGENKKPNKYLAGRKDINDYLDKRSIGAEYGIVTDGIEWGIYYLNISGDVANLRELGHVDLRPLLIKMASDEGMVPDDVGVSEDEADRRLEELCDTFQRTSLEQRLRMEYPKWVREAQKRDVEDFFDLYIELLFGEGGGRYSYQTCLVNEIQRPPHLEAGDSEGSQVRVFAISLMNRLLFTKFLEDTGVLKDGLLGERVRSYEENVEHITGNFYDSYLKPLFYNLFNTPKENRVGKHRKGWFEEVPYLNGGLFRPSIPDERAYSVTDGILKRIIVDLIEGSELREHHEDNRLDPAILGSVFEKTITYIENERNQKDIGAYYTPDDVTSVIVSETLSQKAKDVFVDIFTSHAGGGAGIEEKIRDKSLEEILRLIEKKGTGYYSDPEALEEAEERLLKLRMVDPACGSGHFLTSLMSELYRLWESVYRGKHPNQRPSNEEKYRIRQKIALNCVYGVDADPIAIEIAKLRIWLKIIEGVDWKPQYGALPNIDLNILAGNSLIGLPMKGSGQFPFWSDSVEQLTRLREEHKYNEEGRKRDIQELQDEVIQPQATSAFLNQFEEKREWKGSSTEDVERFLEELSVNDFKASVELIRVRNVNAKQLSQDQIEYLDNHGVKTHQNQAKIFPDDLIKQFMVNGKSGRSEAEAEALEWVRNLNERDLRATSVRRGPLEYDLGQVLSKPFHWPILFPELASEDGNGHEISFDVVVGNPPYGNLVGESETFFLERYESQDSSDIAAPFVERQLQLLDHGGYFGNITTAKLVYMSDIPGFHDMLRHQLENAQIACFAKRPMKVFSGAEVRTAIITGRRSDGETASPLMTSDFIRFNESDRESRLRSISYKPADPHVLTDKIGGERSNSYALLPKVGNEKIESILSHWAKSPRQLKDFVVDEDQAESQLYYRRGNDYWLSAMVHPLYDATTIKELHFDTELQRNLAFLSVHSSLFYLYWMVYGDQFHLNKRMVRRFPAPSTQTIQDHEEKIEKKKDKLWTHVKQAFDSNVNQFKMQPVKPVLDEVDELLGEMHKLDDKLVEYAKGYQEEYRMST